MTAAKRWILPFEEWPPAHQEAWCAGVAAGDVFTETGLGSHWTDKTKGQIVKDYGMWLRYCQDAPHVGLDTNAPASLTIDNLRPYVEQLRERLAPVSVCSRLRGLSESHRVMWPESDRSVLRKVLSRLKRNAAPTRNKTALIHSSRELLEGALDHMEQVIREPAPSDTIRACWVRNAVMVAMLVIYPLRLANLTGIYLGRQLSLEDGDGDGDAHLRFDASETKEKRPITFPMVPAIRIPLEVYVEDYRPVLLDGRDSDALWISTRKGPMKEQAIYEQIVRTTEKLFGHPINPHLFRSCALTTLATEDPSHVRVGARLLGHSSLKTGEQHYNQATMLSAVAQYHDAIAQLRGDHPPAEDGP